MRSRILGKACGFDSLLEMGLVYWRRDGKWATLVWSAAELGSVMS